MIGVVILDDEEHCRLTLAQNLAEIDNVKVLATCGTVEDAYHAIQKHSPDLVFLDIEMPGETGFDLLQKIGEHTFDVIFITAYDQYALQAIKASAIDYLMKPIGIPELEEAIQKHLKKKSGDINRQMEILLQHYSGTGNKKKTIALPTLNGLELVGIDEIIRLQSDGSYAIFHLKDKRKITISKPLKQYEDILAANGFMRIHHSHIVNLNQIRNYTRGEGGYVTMQDGSEAIVSRQKKEELVVALKEL